MKKHFMIDIETTGLDPKTDDILQIAIFELNHDGVYWSKGIGLNIFLPSDRKPENEFAVKNMGWLYEMANKAYTTGSRQVAEDIRYRILDYFKNSCLCEGLDVLLMGKNVTSFDIPFLLEKGFLKANNSAGTNKPDFHYRVYELQGATSLVMDFLNWEDRNSLLELAQRIDQTTIIPDDLVSHDARYDCYLQMQELNGLKQILHNCSSKLAKETIVKHLELILFKQAKSKAGLLF